MTTRITIEANPECFGGYADAYLAALWQALLISTDPEAAALAKALSAEIVRRWLLEVQPLTPERAKLLLQGAEGSEA